VGHWLFYNGTRTESSRFASRVTAIADKLGLDFALIHKKRGVRDAEAPDQMELLVGDVRGKVRGRTFVLLIGTANLFHIQVAILVDDMIDSGRTLSLAVRTLHENGAKAIYALISHGLLSEVKMSMLESLPFERLVVRTPRRDYIYPRRLTSVSGDELDFAVEARLLQACPDRYESHDRREHPKDPQRREYQPTLRGLATDDGSDERPLQRILRDPKSTKSIDILNS